MVLGVPKLTIKGRGVQPHPCLHRIKSTHRFTLDQRIKVTFKEIIDLVARIIFLTRNNRKSLF